MTYQRNTLALRDVAYVMNAHFTLTERAGPTDGIAKFVEIFERRIEKGQSFHQPYLGCREFVAEVEPVSEPPETIRETRDLGRMLWDVKYSPGRNRPLFFSAQLVDGIMEVPAVPEPSAAIAGGAA